MGRETIMDDSAGAPQIGSPKLGNAVLVCAKVSELRVSELEVRGKARRKRTDLGR
jgi:hypothetical protein